MRAGTADEEADDDNVESRETARLLAAYRELCARGPLTAALHSCLHALQPRDPHATAVAGGRPRARPREVAAALRLHVSDDQLEAGEQQDSAEALEVRGSSARGGVMLI